jgi:hypothetical protein
MNKKLQSGFAWVPLLFIFRRGPYYLISTIWILLDKAVGEPDAR